MKRGIKMDKDILINKLRAIINILPLTSLENQIVLAGKANEILNIHFANGGKYIPIDTDNL